MNNIADKRAKDECIGVGVVINQLFIVFWEYTVGEKTLKTS
jgi:hypothetical protein